MGNSPLSQGCEENASDDGGEVGIPKPWEREDHGVCVCQVQWNPVTCRSRSKYITKAEGRT